MNIKQLTVAPALWLGVVVGLALAATPSCGKKPTTAICGADNCQGCCDPDTNTCYDGTSPQACGASGASCLVCNGNQVCSTGQCRSGSGQGGGDAGGSGGVGGGTAGGTAGGMGTGGGSGACSAATCANGCCSANGQCITAQSFTNCGKAGAACMQCPAMTGCFQGACVANTCSTCRDSTGTCKGGPMDNDFCGADGGICLRCNTSNGESCTNGRCEGAIVMCNATTCADGCCSGSTCVRADAGVNTNFQCGTGGSVCATCGTGAMCVNGVCMGGGTGGAGGAGGGLGLDFCSLSGTPCNAGDCCDISSCVASGASCPLQSIANLFGGKPPSVCNAGTCSQ